jgi:hypothetical protein
MGGASFSKSKSSSEQKQQSDSFGYSLNGSNSSSTSGGTSSGYSRGLSGSSQSVFGGDVFAQLYQQALGAAGGIDPSQAQSRVDQLFTGGSSIIDQLSGGGAGADYLTRRLSGDNSDVLNGQIDAIGNDLGRFYSENLNPAITGSAVAGGALGGGRQGVAQGIATEGVTREFATQAANLRAADITNRDNAAIGLLGAQNANAQTALGGLGSLAAIGTNNPGLDIYQQLSGILGGPTTLTESFGQEMSQQQSQEYAQAIADEFGISYDEAHSLMTSKSKGKSIGGGISIGSAGGG